MSTTTIPPFAGKTFEVRYTGLTAINAYANDGKSMRYEITEGPLTGANGEVEFTWKEVANQIFTIVWQEADHSTVVHVDDFNKGISLSYFTTPQNELYRLEGSLTER
jgi:hypothetical protein